MLCDTIAAVSNFEGFTLNSAEHLSHTSKITSMISLPHHLDILHETCPSSSCTGRDIPYLMLMHMLPMSKQYEDRTVLSGGSIFDKVPPFGGIRRPYLSN